MSNPNRRDRARNPSVPAAAWREKEFLNGKIIDAGVVILRTSGCSHFRTGGCSMCGYNTESISGIDPVDIGKQFTAAVADLDDISMLKIYTSGSFLDAKEIPLDLAKTIAKWSADRGQRLLVESRPEYVSDESLSSLMSIQDDLEIALGLESSDDQVLRHAVNKGFTFAQYREASEKITAHGADVRTYVLLKPPFLTEREAIRDAKDTMHDAAKFSKTISLNPVNVQKGTLVERLWRTWAYRPPWLWSVLDVIKGSRDLQRKIVCDPTGGGKERGAHNCGKCDPIILDSIKSFSLSQDFGRLGSPECDCRRKWESVLALEDSVIGGTVDLQRFFRKQRVSSSGPV